MPPHLRLREKITGPWRRNALELLPLGLRIKKSLLSAALSVFSRLIGINRAQALQ
jgi:hypothetical protein